MWTKFYILRHYSIVMLKKQLNSLNFKIENVTNCIIPFVTEHVSLYIFKATLISLSIIFFKHSKGMFNYVSIVGRIYINALYIPFENIIFLFYFKNLPPPLIQLNFSFIVFAFKIYWRVYVLLKQESIFLGFTRCFHGITLCCCEIATV